MTQQILNHFGVDPLRQKVRRSAVPHVVDSDMRQVGPFQRNAKRFDEVVRVPGASGGSSEDKTRLGPEIPRLRSIATLNLSVHLKGYERFRRQGQGATGSSGLRFDECDADSALHLQCPAYRRGRASEVNVGPPEAQSLTYSAACGC